MQYVNLYLPEFRPKREWLTATQSIIILVVFIFGMAAFHRQLIHTRQLAAVQTAAAQKNEADQKNVLPT